jgi:diguanylate cyclase (GGDEF)-like protein/PAS domain S-box-containing protein
MDGARQSLLLIEGDLADATRVREALASQGQSPVEWVTTLAEGMHRLEQPGVTAAILNLFLPDSRGLETFDKARAAGSIPILVLCGAGDEHVGRLAVEHGADDYLLNDHLDRYSVTHAVKSMLDRHAKDAALFAERERAEVTLNSIGDAVLSTDLSGRITYLNVVAERMTGWSRLDAEGKPLEDIFHVIDGVTRTPAINPLELAVREDRTANLTPNTVLIRRDGAELPIEDSAAPIHDRAGQVTGAVIVFRDVTAARRMSAQLSHLAQHDSLTDLPNRILLNDRLEQAISLARRRGSQLAVLFLDLDRFKHVNDSLGHAIGDQLLQKVALRLKRSVRRSDTVGRQGGDEFVVVLSELDLPESAGISAAKLLAALTMPYRIGPHDIRVSVSIGVSLYPDDADHADRLISNADTAMYYAKEQGRNSYMSFRPDMVVRAAERQFIEAGLRVALERQEFSLNYQPKMDLGTGAMVGVEALLRWQHPVRGFIPPAQFISIAEDTGLMLPIGRWVLREACRQSCAWLDAGLPRVPVAVNISALEFRSPDFVGTVRAILTDTGLDPQSLELELTESALMTQASATISMLNALKDLGVQVAVDDFGTGYSSLSYLRQFPIDALKVDQSFVQEITSRPDDPIIVRAVISMAHSLRKRVIAEGVEDREQLDFLTAAGCEEGQGYFFDRPMTADQFATLLAAHSI